MVTPYMDLRAGPTRKVMRRTSRLCNPQNTNAPPRRYRGCQNTCFYITLTYVCRSVLSREHWRMALSKPGKNVLGKTTRIGLALAVLSYYTDQILTLWSKDFSAGSTLNDTPGGDRWARVLCGRLAVRRSPFTESTLTALDVRIWKCKPMKKIRKETPPHPKHTT